MDEPGSEVVEEQVDEGAEEGEEEAFDDIEEEIPEVGAELSDDEVLDALFAEVDDDTKEEDVEEEEPGADDKEEKEKEESSPLDDLANLMLDDEKEEKEEVDPFENITDEAIQKQMWLVPDYASWMKAAKDDGEEVSPDFAALVAKGGISPSYLGERGISSIDGIVGLLESLEERVDPNAVMLPDPNDAEAVREFDATHRDIPQTPEDYDENIFVGTAIETDKEAQMIARLDGAQYRFDNSQLAGVLEILEREQGMAEEESNESYAEYRKEQDGRIAEDYGEDAREVITNVNRVLKQHGRQFAEKFFDSKALKSKEFVDFVTSLVESGANEGDIKFEDVKLRLQTVSDAKLNQVTAQLKAKVNDADENAHKSAKHKKAARVLNARWLAIHNERSRRGLA